MTVKAKTFVVEGTYPFPADMLRYDQCWPATSDDAVQLAEAMTHRRVSDPNRKRTVKLFTNAANRPTTGRWESFGWRVIT